MVDSVCNPSSIFSQPPTRRSESAEMSGTSCANCGLPNAQVAVPIQLKPENGYRRISRKLFFCSDQCALQMAFLQLPARITAESITRYFRNQPIRFADFRKISLDRPETISKTRVNSGAAEAKNERLDLPYVARVNGTKVSLLKRQGGRPRKWGSEAERKRDYRARTRRAEHV